MNIWYDIESNRIKPNEFIAVVEISKGSKQKYEVLELATDEDFIMLTRITEKMFDGDRYVFVWGHYNALGQETIGRIAGHNLGAYVKGIPFIPDIFEISEYELTKRSAYEQKDLRYFRLRR